MKNIFHPSGYLLMVEDEPIWQDYNNEVLKQCGYPIQRAYTLAEARKIIAEELPRAILLDIHLPDGMGFELLQELRKISNIPVFILTAKGTPDDIVKGFEAGGDDYLPKPYDLSVFYMRLMALLRRASLIPDILDFGSIKIDMASSKAYLNGEDMGLQQKELSLLQQFMQHPEEMLSAEYLYEKVWGQKMLGKDSALKVAISKLRAKLAESDYTIVASRGEGYCFERI